MADETAQTALVFDARPAVKGAAEFRAAGQSVIADSRSVEAALSKVAAATQAGAGIAEVSSNRIVTSSSKQAQFLDQLARKYDPITAAINKQGSEIARLNGIIAQGGENASRAAGALAVVQRKLADTQMAASVASKSQTAALTGLSAAARIGFTNMEILKSGAINVVQSLASGASAAQVFQTQLLQTAPALPALAAAMGLTGVAAIALATGVGVVVGGLAIATISFTQHQEAIRGLQNSLQPLGGQYKELAARIDETALASSRFSGTGADDFRALGASIAKVAPGMASDLGDVFQTTKDLAEVYGGDFAKASQTVVQSFKDPAAAAKNLAENGFDLMTHSAQRSIELMLLSGDRAGATAKTMDILARSTAGAADNTSDFTKAWRNFQTTITDVIHSLEPLGEMVLVVGGKTVQILAAVDRYMNPISRAAQLIYGAWKSVNGAAEQAAKPPAAVADPFAAQKRSADDLAESINALSKQRQDLAAKAQQFRTALENPAFALSAEQTKSYQEALGRLGFQLHALRDPIESYLKGLNDQVAAYERYAGAGRSVAEGEMALANASEQANRAATPAEKTAARAATLKILAGQYVDVSMALIEQTEAQLRINAAWEEGDAAAARQINTERARVEALRFAEAGTRDYDEMVKRLAADYGQLATAQGGATVAQAILRQKEQLDLGQAELAAIGSSIEARAVLIAKMQAENTLRAQGRDLTSAQSQAYIENAEALARLQLDIDRNNQALQDVAQFGDKAASSLIDFATQSGTAVTSLGDTLRALGAEMQQLILKLAILNPLKNALLGQNLPTLGTLANVVAGSGSGSGSGGTTSAVGSLLSNPIGTLTSAYSAFTGGVGNLLFGQGVVGAAGPQLATSGLLGSGGTFLGSEALASFASYAAPIAAIAIPIIMSLFKQKPSVGPGGNLWFNGTNGEFARTGGGGDNGYDPGTLLGDATKIIQSLDSVAKALGAKGYTGRAGADIEIGYDAGAKAFRSGLATPAGYKDSLTSTDWQAVVDHALFVGLKNAELPEAGAAVGHVLAKSAAATFADLSTEINAAFAFQKVYDQLGDAVKVIGPFETALAAVKDQFKGIRETAEGYGLALGKVDAAQAKAIENLRGDFGTALSTATEQAQGRQYLGAARALVEGFEANLRDAAALGLRKDGEIQVLLEAQLREAFSGLNVGQLQDVMTTLAGSNATVARLAGEAAAALNAQAAATAAATVATEAATAATAAAARAEAEIAIVRRDRAANSNLDARAQTVQGQAMLAELTRFDEQARQEREAAASSDVEYLARLETVLGMERAAIVRKYADAATADLERAASEATAVQERAAAEAASAAQQQADAAVRLAEETASTVKRLQQEAAQLQIGYLQDVVSKAEAASTQWNGFASSLSAFRQGLLVGEFSPLSPAARLAEAQGQFRSTASRAQLGDVAAINDLQGLATAYLKANQDFNASSNPAAFDEVQAVLASTESVAVRQARIADEQLTVALGQLQVAKDQLAVLQGKAVTGGAEGNALVDALSGMLNNEFEQIFAVARGKGFNPDDPEIRRRLMQGGAENYSIFGDGAQFNAIFAAAAQQIAAAVSSAAITDIAGASAWAQTVGNPGYAGYIEQLARQRGVTGLLPMLHGGIVGAMVGGGMVGNGMWNVDSVVAKYAGGGNIALAGGEFVTPAPMVTPRTFPVLEGIRRGVVPGNDNGTTSEGEQRKIRLLEEQNKLLRAILSTNAQGHLGTRAAIDEGLKHSAEMAQEARLRRSAPRTGTTG